MDDDGDLSDEGLNAGADEPAESELTPNDIFGLDPLDVLTLEELAEYLKVSTAAAHRVIKEQKLPGRNIGGEWRFLRDAVANWLRCQEAPVQQQQKAREDYSKAKDSSQNSSEPERFSRPPQRAFQSEQSGGEYRPRQRFPDEEQHGNQRGGQYGNRGGQYGGNGGNQYGGGQYGGGSGYSRPPRRPFRAAEGDNGGEGGSVGGQTGGYGGGGAPGTRFGGGGYASGSSGYAGGGGGGGGYAGGGQRFGGGPKRKNKRQVFDNERGKRLDRRKEGDAPESGE